MSRRDRHRLGWSLRDTVTRSVLVMIAVGCSSNAPLAPDAQLPTAEPTVVMQVLAEERPFALRLAFGSHPSAEPDDDGHVDAAIPRNQKIRIVFSTTMEDVANEDDQLLDGAVQIICDGQNMEYESYNASYVPFGSQNATSLVGLGPRIEIETDLKASADCGIEMAEWVVGPDGQRPCAPPGGDPESDCTPGDLSRIAFSTEPFGVAASHPLPGATNASRDATIVLQFNSWVAPDTVDKITLRGPAGVIGTAILMEFDQTVAEITPDSRLDATTAYEVVVPGGPGGVLDHLGGELPADYTLSFTTANQL